MCVCLYACECVSVCICARACMCTHGMAMYQYIMESLLELQINLSNSAHSNESMCFPSNSPLKLSIFTSQKTYQLVFCLWPIIIWSISLPHTRSFYTHTHTHTHIYIYIYVCVYIYIYELIWKKHIYIRLHMLIHKTIYVCVCVCVCVVLYIVTIYIWRRKERGRKR